jgi:protein gp37
MLFSDHTPMLVLAQSRMIDSAHARISEWQIAKVLAVMAVARRHQFQVLTKHPRRLAKLLSHSDFRKMMAQSMFFGPGAGVP